MNVFSLCQLRGNMHLFSFHLQADCQRDVRAINCHLQDSGNGLLLGLGCDVKLHVAFNQWELRKCKGSGHEEIR